MSTAEIVFNMLEEVSTTELSKAEQPNTFEGNRSVAQRGGEVAGIARKALEDRTGKPILTSQNAAQLNAVVTNIIEDVVSDDDNKNN